MNTIEMFKTIFIALYKGITNDVELNGNGYFTMVEYTLSYYISENTILLSLYCDNEYIDKDEEYNIKEQYNICKNITDEKDIGTAIEAFFNHPYFIKHFK